MRLDPGELSTIEVRRRFDSAAGTFDNADYVHRTTCDGLLDRLDPVAIAGGLVVDLGSASGSSAAALAKRFRKGRVISVDVSRDMLRKGADRRSFLSRVREVQADAKQLPLAAQSADLVFANMLLPWLDSLDDCFAEVNRVLKKDAVFAFSSLGPDSMREFRYLGETCRFPDMHDVGDALVRAGLRDPVLDVDRLRITWSSIADLFDDLLACGAVAGTPEDLESADSGFPNRDEAGQLAIELELVFGHAWGSGPRPDAGEFRVDPGAIGRRHRP